MRTIFKEIALVGLSTLLAWQPGQAQQSYDVLIRGGRVIDGTGAPAQAVSPGFIDVHTHADEVAEHPFAEHFVRMGVTTVVAGNCGGSADDIAAAIRTIEKTGVSINWATLVGHNTLRRAVMGSERRAPTPAELAKMQGLVERAMTDGAVGFSTGLQVRPRTYADASEIAALATSASKHGGLYATHMRNAGTELEAAVKEALDVGEAISSCPRTISRRS